MKFNLYVANMVRNFENTEFQPQSNRDEFFKKLEKLRFQEEQIKSGRLNRN